MDTKIISNKKKCQNDVAGFFETMFGEALKQNCGEIEIRVFPKKQQAQSYFFSTVDGAVNKSYQLCNNNIDVYFGVNLRVGQRGKKENIRYISAFHAEIDYGLDGHKKMQLHKTYDDALNVINNFYFQPTLVVHSGGGFHCYWVYSSLFKIKTEDDVKYIENINKEFCGALGGDSGTHNIDRVLRVPGTYNYKLKNNSRPVNIITLTDKIYTWEDLEIIIPYFMHTSMPDEKIITNDINQTHHETEKHEWDESIDNIPVSEKIKGLIINGNDGTYASRSEADMAVILALVNKGFGDGAIKNIFERYSIGEKYKEHNDPERYLKHNIKQASEMSNLTEDERQNPIFISGALNKTDRNIVKLDSLKYQEHITRKFKIKQIDDIFYRYNGKCFDLCKLSELNSICQKELELSGYRKLFTKQAFSDFLHFATGSIIESSSKVFNDQLSYLTLQNGLYNLAEERLQPHTSDIFTTNLLLYDYNPDAKCPRFLKYLDEVFMSDISTINFVQEAVGYVLHKSIPMPALFFLIGNGSNGKSVLTDVLTDLFGEHNACSISLDSLSDEYYLFELCNKMINVSGETPHKKRIASNIIKQVTAGDLISAREPHKSPVKFRPYAKHFLAMNDNPVIDDNSHGMWRRIYIIEFLKTFTKEEMDVHLREKLRKELPGIFTWALEGYRKLRGKDFKLQESHSMENFKQQYMLDSEAVLMFASEKLIKVTNSNEVRLREAHEAYKKYIEKEGLKSFEKKTSFRKILERNGYQVDKSTKDGNQICIFNVELTA